MSLQSQLAALISAVGADVKALQQTTGWQTTSGFTFSSADAPTFVATTSSDLTSFIPVGAKLKLTQTTVKYFIVTAISSSTITLYGGTDYVLANAAISLVSYSLVKSPVGFPTDPAKWTVTATDSTQRTQSSPVTGTYYNLGGSIILPIGAWVMDYSMIATNVRSGAGALFYDFQATLSTANNTESNSAFSFYAGLSTTASGISQFAQKLFPLTVAAKTTYFLNLRSTSGTSTSLRADSNLVPAIIRAVCAYL